MYALRNGCPILGRRGDDRSPAIARALRQELVAFEDDGDEETEAIAHDVHVYIDELDVVDVVSVVSVVVGPERSGRARWH